MRRLIAAMAVLAVACGGGDAGEEDTGSTRAPASTTPAAAAGVGGGQGGAVHTIDMVLNDRGQYLYVPDQLTIRAGDTVRWINVSGGPHNVQFRSDGVPGGAGEVLNAAMANRMGPLNGPLMVQPDQVYEISFAGAPAGVYDYTCTPHELLGMNATLTVQN